jgi:hypothetical protein
MWHTVFTIFKGKGEEGQNKKYFAKKWKEGKASYWCSQARIRKKIEKNFFWIFVILLNFFWILGLFLQYVA